MKIRYCTDYDRMSMEAAASFMTDLKKRREQWMGAATGNSTRGLYKMLLGEYVKDPMPFEHLGIIKLDEWGGIPLNSPHSCDSFIRQKIIGPLRIPENRYLTFESNPSEPETECRRMRLELHKMTLDICILGLGQNGHIGFNEPAPVLEPYCHVAQLSKTSQQHLMVANLPNKPGYGMTLGMAEILRFKKIIFLITGEGKQKVVDAFLTAKINPRLPASFLWLHPNVECYIDCSNFPRLV